MMWSLTKYVVDVHILNMYTDIHNNKYKEMQFNFLNLHHLTVFITTPKVSGTGLNLTAANVVIISQTFTVLNKLCQVLAHIIQLGQNREPHSQLQNRGPA